MPQRKKDKRSLALTERIDLLNKLEPDDIKNFNIKELIQEQEMYKIELEMQNEELRFAQTELEKTKNKYRSLFETAPVGFFTLDQKGAIIEANEKGVALLGVQSKKIIGQLFQQFIQPHYLTTFYNFFKGLQESSEKGFSEIQLLHTFKYVQMEGIFYNEVNSKHFYCQLAIIDVTQRKKQEIRYAEERLNQQKVILNTILHTQEEERIRIAEALHNGLGQLLYATKLKLEDIKENKTVKKQIQDFLDEAITETRNLSFILMPSLLKDFGLKIILEETAKRFSTKIFKLDCTVIGFKERLPSSTETIIFRIIQELLNNILKHSHATEAHILLRKTRNKLNITVTDNGTGFNVGKSGGIHAGTGLKSIYNRVELLNGTVDVSSRSGKGTVIKISITV